MMTSYSIHRVVRVEVRDASLLSCNVYVRHISVFDADGNKHDITLFAPDADASKLRIGAEEQA